MRREDGGDIIADGFVVLELHFASKRIYVKFTLCIMVYNLRVEWGLLSHSVPQDCRQWEMKEYYLVSILCHVTLRISNPLAVRL